MGNQVEPPQLQGGKIIAPPQLQHVHSKCLAFKLGIGLPPRNCRGAILLPPCNCRGATFLPPAIAGVSFLAIFALWMHMQAYWVLVRLVWGLCEACVRPVRGLFVA